MKEIKILVRIKAFLLSSLEWGVNFKVLNSICATSSGHEKYF
jgi:hypothetical protein